MEPITPFSEEALFCQLLLQFSLLRVRDALEERAGAGIEIFVLYDDVGSSDLPAAYIEDMRSAGI